jgi:hypothetical protein
MSEPFPRLFTQGMVTMFSPAENKVLKMSKVRAMSYRSTMLYPLRCRCDTHGDAGPRPAELDAEWVRQ